MTNDNKDDAGNDLRFMPAILPDRSIDPMDFAFTVLSTASDAARATAKTTAEMGKTVVGLVFEDDGSLAIGKDGLVLVTKLPIHAVETEEGRVGLTFDGAPDRMVSPKDAAEQLGVSVSTLKRQRYTGDIAEPHQLSPRRVGWKQSELMPIVAAGGLHEYVKAKAESKKTNGKE